MLLQLEELETRALLSASGVTAETNLTIAPAQSSGFSGYTPAQIEAAYGVPTSVTVNGTSQLAGTGETIAIVDAYNDPNIKSDLATFDAAYSLPTANLTVVNQNGGSSLPANNASWAVEESLDVEWAHAIAPGANIILVEASSNSLQNLMTAVQTAASTQGVNVVSMSWGAGEFNGETAYDGYFQPSSSTNLNGYQNNAAVTFVASAGDSSAMFGPEWPASSPYVLAVGGTTLNVNSSNPTANQTDETVWSASDVRGYGEEGGGGGISSYETNPSSLSFQSSNGVDYSGRSTPDVSWDANPSTGVSIYDSYGEPGWGYVGGTSVGAPSWAGVVAIADQQAGSSLSTSTVETTLYGAYSKSGGASYTSGSEYTSIFNDITTGNNGYAAGKGYDLATGLGSPKVSALVGLLADPSSPPPASTPPPATSPPPPSPPPSPPHHGRQRDILGTSGGTSVSSVVVTATNVPINVPAISSVGSTVTSVNNVSAFSIAFAEPTMFSTSNTPLLSGSLDSSRSQSALVFGASGWNGSAFSWHLSSLGLSAPMGGQLGDDLPEDLQDVSGQSPGDAVRAGLDASSDDSSFLDITAPPLLDNIGSESDGGESGSDGGDGGSAGGE